MVVHLKSDADNSNYLVAENLIKVADHFTFLGSIISSNDYIDYRAADRGEKAPAIFGKLSHF